MRRETLLCVANFPTNTGFAWTFLEGLYAAIADRLAPEGIRTLVAYPRIHEHPHTLAGSAAIPVELDATLATAASLRATVSFVRRETVRVTLAIDRPPRHVDYALLRVAGVRRILVYDHGSGQRPRSHGVRRALKHLYARLPGCAADQVIAVSDYVLEQQAESWLMPRERIVRVWNGISVPREVGPPGAAAHAAFGLDHTRPLVVCACRAIKAKGVLVLLDAFEHLLTDWPSTMPRPALLYLGDGPDFPGLQAKRTELRARGDVLMPGRRSDVLQILRDASVVVVPSLWEEAFGLAALEPMSLGRPVIASRVGALPEIVQDGVTGRLVPPGDVPALAKALLELLSDPALCRRLGAAGRERVRTHFSQEEQVRRLTEVIRPGFAAGPSR